MNYLDDIDLTAPEFGDLYDELPLWSAPFGLLLLDRVPMKCGLTILDVGAGTGFMSIELAERCGSDTQVIAVDPWSAGMARLRRKAEGRGLTNIRLLEQDAGNLELPDASVDIIVSNLGINNFEHPSAVLKQCYRVARPQGMLLLTTNLVGHMAEFYEAYRAVLIETGRRDRLAALDQHVSHRATIESASRLLKEAGFTVVDTATDSFRMRFADGTSLLRHSFIRLGFMPGWKVVAGDRVEQTFAALESRLNQVAAERGCLSLTIPVACLIARRSGNEGH